MNTVCSSLPTCIYKPLTRDLDGGFILLKKLAYFRNQVFIKKHEALRLYLRS